MERIKICFITDNNFAIATAVAIQSLIENKDYDSQYEINVLGVNISDFHRKKISGFIADNVVLKFIETSLDKYEHIQNSNHVSSTALLKFDLAEIFNEYDKILYLDGDILVQKDLSELYNSNLGDNLVFAARDMCVEKIYKEHKHIKVDKYFNSGVMILNLQKIREENLNDRLIEAKINNPNWPFMDQHSFNYTFNERVCWLELKYNAMIPLYLMHGHPLEEVNSFYGSNYQSFYEMQEDASIIHFAGEANRRPWKIINGTMSDIWMRYYNNSPYKNIDLDRKFFIAETDEFIEIKNNLYGLGDYVSSIGQGLDKHSLEISKIFADLKDMQRSALLKFERIIKYVLKYILRR